MVNYAVENFDKEHMAKAISLALPISTKYACEICTMLRGRELSMAKNLLEKVITKEHAVPFKRHFKNIGHRKKIGPGRYPFKASKEILKLLLQVEANAQFKGLNTSSLFISHICANKAGVVWHRGRQRRIRMKRTNVEVAVVERAANKEKQNKKKTDKK